MAYAVCDHGFPIELCRYDAAHPPAGRAAASPPVQHGWSCPGCGHSYAPWVPECHHCPAEAAKVCDLRTIDDRP